MLGAILKLSYNRVGETPVVGGICGTCFFANKHLITAKHALNARDYKPNDGYVFCQYWVLINDQVLELSPDLLVESPDIDLTVINTPQKLNDRASYEFSLDREIGTKCYNDSYIGGSMPQIDARWDEEKLVIEGYSLDDKKIRGAGKIESIKTAYINSKDINMSGTELIEVSYESREGMSGGPLVNEETGKVIGLMSVGLPADKKIKKQLFAITSDKILKELNSLNIM